MVFYRYTCPDCGANVKLDYQTVQHQQNKVCACESEPVETVEDTGDD
jgi:hypothetical protein